MRVATIDLGTNTCLLFISEQKAGRLNVLVDEVRTVRLGQGVHQNKKLHSEALERADQCFSEFAEMIKKHQPIDQVLAIATSAARDAENNHELLKIAEKHHIPLKIISGLEEARLSYLGVSKDFDPEEKIAVIDIGGGSTEIIFGQGTNRLSSQSLNMGGVRMTEIFIQSQPVIEEQAKALEEYISETLIKEKIAEKLCKVDRIIAVAGTPTTLAGLLVGGYKADLVDGYKIQTTTLETWRQKFAQASIEELKSKYHLGGRADIIFAGTTILSLLMQASTHAQFFVSIKGLRYGIAYDLFSR